MGRFLLGVVFAAAVSWLLQSQGISIWAAEGGPEGPGGAGGSMVSEFVEQGPGTVDPVGFDGGASLADVWFDLRDGGHAAIASGQRVGQADRDWVGAQQRIAGLGSNNDFLFSEPGRRFALGTLRVIEREAESERAGLLSRMFRVAANGRIEEADLDARATLSEIRRALQEAVGRRPGSGLRTYEVQPGDTLSGIAAELRSRFGLEISSRDLQEANDIKDPRRVRAGQELTLPNRALRVTVWVAAGLVSIESEDLVLRTFRCGVSPRLGEWLGESLRVGESLIEPAWTTGAGETLPAGDPRNPLGSRFLRLLDADGEPTRLGLHGTWDQRVLGRHDAPGLVSLANVDVEELVKTVQPGTEVLIHP